MLTEERIDQIHPMVKDFLHWKRAFARAIEAEVMAVAQEQVAWFAFADSNGQVPLELWGFDQKACKHAVLENARSVGWKGTIEGYLLSMGWAIRPLYAAPQPPAPCPRCAARVADLFSEQHKVDALLAENDKLQAKIAEQSAEFTAFHNRSHDHSTRQDERIRELELYVGNLLARIHRDGGHYQAEHGNLKAVRAADIIVAKLNAQFDEQSVLIERCRWALKVAKVYHSFALHKVDVYPKCNIALAAIAAYKKGDSKDVT